MNRRKFVATSIAAGAATIASSAARAAEKRTVRIVGVSCSPRKGKTTATAVGIALEAAKAVDSRVKTALVDLGGMEISGSSGGANTTKDDFDKVLPMFANPIPDGIIIGSPSYFRSMSALCKAFLERLAVLRKPRLILADVPTGVLAVGAYRNGGQELVIEQIQSIMLCHEVMIVGGKPGAHQGATLWNAYDDDITKDEFGMATAKQLGIRVAEAALRLTAAKA
ncbi:MAG: flavodoxin family protein [Phycisphaerales bacterium]|nr:MAG: flavodoxin family protein [Phycisphaerales bacterium]UCF15802.1 MAG: flavodoxin family protein [Phycisphaerales bacterium]UCG49305.1 MAG: flavodoxin family protein [Phycisphaerales bacterium]